MVGTIRSLLNDHNCVSSAGRAGFYHAIHASRRHKGAAGGGSVNGLGGDDITQDQRTNLLESATFKVATQPAPHRVDLGTIADILSTWRDRWSIDLDLKSRDGSCEIAVQFPTVLAILISTGMLECCALPQFSRGRIAPLFSGRKSSGS